MIHKWIFCSKVGHFYWKRMQWFCQAYFLGHLVSYHKWYVYILSVIANFGSSGPHSVFVHIVVIMDWFSQLFTPPKSPSKDLREIRTMDHELETERRWVRAKLFMNQVMQMMILEGILSHITNNHHLRFYCSPTHNPANLPDPVNPPVIVNEYNSFNLVNVTPHAAPKWKNNKHLLDEYRKFKHSCQRNCVKPISYITSGKVKTNMFLIWAGPNGEDIYNKFRLTAVHKYDINYVMQQFEEFCAPICNFRAARFKFTKVFQK